MSVDHSDNLAKSSDAVVDDASELEAPKKGYSPTAVIQATAENAGRLSRVSSRSLSRTHLFVVVAIAILANFCLFANFGLYEDDWLYFGAPYVTPHKEWLKQMWWAIATFQVGRPVQLFFVYIFAYLGAKLDSIPFLYASAACLYGGSVALLYKVLRLRYPASFAFLATVVFALCPLTTLRQFLNGVLGFAPGFIFLFLAYLLYARKKYVWSYLAAAAALLTYETLFLPFLIAPIFKRGKRSYREFLIHSTAWAVVFISYLAFRIHKAETRVAGAVTSAGKGLAWGVIHFDVFFALHSFSAYFYAVYLSCRESSWADIFWSLALLLPTMSVWLHTRRAEAPASPHGPYVRTRRIWWVRNALLPGALALFASYLLSYWHLQQNLVFPVADRDTRISTAACLGSSLFVVALIYLGFTLRARFWRVLFSALTSLLLFSLFLYSFIIQDDYVKDWNSQRLTLDQIMMLTPDADAHTLIVMNAVWSGSVAELFPKKERAPAMGQQKHGLLASWHFLFRDPQLPTLFFAYSDVWPQFLRHDARGNLFWKQETFFGGWGVDPKVPVGTRVIHLVEHPGGTITRDDKPIIVDGQRVNLISGGQLRRAEDLSNWSAYAKSDLSAVMPPFAFTFAARSLSGGPVPYLATRLRVRFPADKPPTTGRLEPLVVAGVANAADLATVRYLGGNRISFRIDHWGFPGIEGGAMNFDPDTTYSLEYDEYSDGTVLKLDGEPQIRLTGEPFPATPGQVEFGKNSINAGTALPSFSGKILSMSIGPPPNVIAIGTVQFPDNARTVKELEPLVVTGAPGMGDLISVRYLGNKHLTFRIDHWGSPGAEGGEMVIDPKALYSIEVNEGEAGTVLKVNGQEKVGLRPKAFYTTQDEITFGVNKIGGGITGPTFSGKVLSSAAQKLD